VQDYTQIQLMVLARYFSRAHFLLLGDENQAIREGTASFEQIAQIFEQTHGSVERCQLMTSYRSSPEITELFASLMDDDKRMNLSSVRLPGIAPTIIEQPEREAYLDTLRELASNATGEEGLTAIVTADQSRAKWLGRQLGDAVHLMRKDEALPASGIVVMDLRLAKGLEFDHVIIPDAQEEVYPPSELSRRRLYTAISRAMHRITIVAQGPLSPLVAKAVHGS
jgi:DNA helicase-2/ATP-dependent DNA helicase PcrA